LFWKLFIMYKKVGHSFGVASLLVAFFCIYSFTFQDELKNEIFVEGQVYYNFDNPTYQPLRVEGKIYEDGKFYRTFFCDAKGKFSTSVGINHDYTFHFSMDYHGTTKVLVSTKIPEENRKKQIGGLFKFKCELFERVEGLSLVILKKPIIKIRYLPEKDKFEPDKAYTESFLLELESFRETLLILKSRNKSVLKDASSTPKKETLAQRTTTTLPKPEKKGIENPNPRGHRNIMDNLKNDKEEAIEEKEIEHITEDILVEETTVDGSENSDSAALEKVIIPELVTKAPYVQVVPKREKIEFSAQLRKTATKQMASLTRDKEMEKVKTAKQVNWIALAAKERQQLSNKQIQSLRLQSIIKTVAIKEMSTKKGNARQQAVKEKTVLPTIRTISSETWLKSSKKIKVIYPTETIVYLQESYWFGIHYYYKNNEEVTEQFFCRETAQYEQINALCANP
jgi:hypothetical protein